MCQMCLCRYLKATIKVAKCRGILYSAFKHASNLHSPLLYITRIWTFDVLETKDKKIPYL